QRLYLDALMRIGHDLLPRHSGQRAAGHAVGRRVIVVAVPDAGDVVAGVTDEPRIAVRVGGAGLARRLDAVEHRALAGPFLDHLVHHEVHVHRDLRADHLHRLLAVAIETPHDLAVAAAHFQHRMRRYRLAEIGEGGVAGSVIEDGHFRGADRQRG